MAKRKVVKRSGKHQGFSLKKMEKSIDKASRDFTRNLAKSIERTIGRKNFVKTKKIRDEIVKKLDKLSKGAAKEWRKYERKLNKKF